jgi:hypothetical protein
MVMGQLSQQCYTAMSSVFCAKTREQSAPLSLVEPGRAEFPERVASGEVVGDLKHGRLQVSHSLWRAQRKLTHGVSRALGRWDDQPVSESTTDRCRPIADASLLFQEVAASRGVDPTNVFSIVGGGFLFGYSLVYCLVGQSANRTRCFAEQSSRSGNSQ